MTKTAAARRPGQPSARRSGTLPARVPARRSPLPLVVSLLAAASLGAGAWLLTHPSGPELGVTYPDQGRDHITLGTPHVAYNSFPATSGPHTEFTAPLGLSSVPIAQETLVHNLEHGQIVVSYRPEKVDANGLEALRRLAAAYPTKVVVVPVEKLPEPVALAAWTRLYTLQAVDLSKMTDFVARYKDHAPEFFAD